MANWTIKNVAFRGVTGTVPNHPVKTSDIPLFTQEEADTFDQTVGIRNRYWSSDDICTSDLCADAAERLITARFSDTGLQDSSYLGYPSG